MRSVPSAGGRAADGLLYLGAAYAGLAGWLRVEVGQHGIAMMWLRHAVEWGQTSGNFAMVSQSLYRMSTTARLEGDQPDSVSLDGNTLKVGAVLGTDWGNHRHLLMAHEGGHTISLPDTYGGPGGHGYVGGWDLMGNLGGPSSGHLAWHKWKLEWLDDEQMSCLATRDTRLEQTLTPIETAGDAKAVVVRYGNTRAYVAEVRTRNGVNSGSCDTGVLVYSVDSNVSSGSGPVRVMDSSPRSGGCRGNERCSRSLYG